LKIFVPPVKSNKQVTKLSNQLGLGGATEGFAHEIILAAKKQKLTSGRSARSIAAAACYIASKVTCDSKTQREVAEVANVTEVTIRNRYKEMKDRLQIVVYL
jgi:transcription initiation factor TFIIB